MGTICQVVKSLMIGVSMIVDEIAAPIGVVATCFAHWKPASLLLALHIML